MALLATDARAAEPVTLPITLTHRRPRLEAKINGAGPYAILLDTACTIPTLHPEVMDALRLTPSGRVRIVGIAGEERAPTYSDVRYEFGDAAFIPRRVASLASERESSRRRRDGVIGSSFFRKFVVEIDIDQKQVRLHEPAAFAYSGKGELISFKFREEIPVVEASIEIPGQPDLKGEFEVDTGCDSGLCIGEKFVKEHKLIEAIESRTSEKFGIGGSVDTRIGKLPVVRFGNLKIEKAETDLFLDGSPVDEPMVGHIGMGVLHRYRVIFDYSRKQLILESR